eukprot:TRINITY_DN31353_c0_g1_i1.p1 TRINITY_DN31353_c0_g1~~TRINITY_DN31353_c0_g1_i1.p1  ORF type:complete len:751 (+),score=199.10 TRINITY_DN31353_c0_g1_i1:151-2403(+)
MLNGLLETKRAVTAFAAAIGSPTFIGGEDGCQEEACGQPQKKVIKEVPEPHDARGYSSDHCREPESELEPPRPDDEELLWEEMEDDAADSQSDRDEVAKLIELEFALKGRVVEGSCGSRKQQREHFQPRPGTCIQERSEEEASINSDGTSEPADAADKNDPVKEMPSLAERLQQVKGAAAGAKGAGPPKKRVSWSDLQMSVGSGPPSFGNSPQDTPRKKKTSSRRSRRKRPRLFVCRKQVAESKFVVLFPGFIADNLWESLRILDRHPAAQPFLALPQPNSVMAKYWQSIEDPVDLQTIHHRLASGAYESASGEVLPHVFWTDVRKIWENQLQVLQLHGTDAQQLQLAEDMRLTCEDLERTFWDDDAGWGQGNIKDVEWIRMLRGWGRERLRNCLKMMKMQPQSAFFQSPFPWQRLELHDYPDVVQDAIDLRTIADRLKEGFYDIADEEGELELDSGLFWEDVSRCWSNCKMFASYYKRQRAASGPKSAEMLEALCRAAQAASFMQRTATSLEEEYWSDLALLQPLGNGVRVDGCEARGITEGGLYALSQDTQLSPFGSCSGSSSSGEEEAHASAEDAKVVEEQQLQTTTPGERPHKPSDGSSPEATTRRARRRSTSQESVARLIDEEDQQIHFWCQKQLRICAKSLRRNAEENFCCAADEGSDDFKIIAHLCAVAEELEAGCYCGKDGYIHPDLFWTAVRKCWRWAGKHSNAAVKTFVKTYSRDLEHRFWHALGRYEATIAETADYLSF